MSIDIPAAIESDIIQFAHSEHITTAEAVIQLIKAGLETNRHTDSQNAILSGIGLFSDSEDAILLDEAVAIAYQERRRSSFQVI